MPYIHLGITTDGSASVLYGTPHNSFAYEKSQNDYIALYSGTAPSLNYTDQAAKVKPGTYHVDYEAYYMLGQPNRYNCECTLYDKFNDSYSSLGWSYSSMVEDDSKRVIFGGSADLNNLYDSVLIFKRDSTNMFGTVSARVSGQSWTKPIYSAMLFAKNCKLSADKTTGYSGDIITLYSEPSAGYDCIYSGMTGAELTGNQFMFTNSDVLLSSVYNKMVSITLTTDGNGTLTASQLTGYEGDTATLTPTYNTYYRFKNYTQTGGGSVVGDTYTFGTADATIQANFSANVFTASGKWETGSNVSPTNPTSSTKDTYANVRKYAITSYHTSNVPSSWYSTSSRWNPSNASAYSITLNPIMKVQGTKQTNYTHGTNSVAFATLIGSTYTNTANFSPLNPTGASTANTARTATYTKTITTSTQSTYSISARLHENWYNKYCGYANYLGNQTTGTWTATGYIP